MSRKQSGFTLIELMIVMVLIAILAALAIPRFMQASAKSKQTSAVYILTKISESEKDHYKTNGIYANVGSTARPGESFDLLGVDIPCNDLYTYTITETPLGGLLITAEGNIDGDATIDTWTVDLSGDNPINTINDITN